MKKSFILYYDSLRVLDDLSNEQAGQLFKAIKETEENPEVTLPGLLNAILTPFKNQIKRDTEKYKKIVEKRREAGIASGKARHKREQVLTSVKSVEQKGTKRTLTVNDTVNDNDTKKNRIIYTHTPKTLKTIDEILANGKHERHELIIKFISYIKTNLQNVSKLPKQISYVEAGKLFDQYSPNQVKTIVNQMENWKPLTKKNNSVYLTILSWIGRER